MLATYCNIVATKTLQQQFDLFKLDSTPPNILQHVATGWPNACNTLRAAMLKQQFDLFKLDPKRSNILQHVARGWPNVCNTLRAAMLQYVALKCCERLTGT